MIFLGDFVYPFKTKKNIYKFSEEMLNESKVLNLEGAILDPDNSKVITKGTSLYSSIFAYDVLKSLNVKAVGLANNHIFDYQIDINKQKRELKDRNIVSCGAGTNINEALKAALIEDNKYKYVVLSFGWDVAGCINAKLNQYGVAPLVEERMIKSINNAKKMYNDRKIIVYVHWNYVSEYYPQPADRKLAFSAIDAGADAIIGHHPHIVGVYEIYKNKPIFYSLGNFFMPTSMGLGDLSKIGLGVKYDEEISNIILFWTENCTDKLNLVLKEKLIDTNKLEDISSLYQHNLSDYVKWFKKHRRKKKLLPIYKGHDQSLTNQLLLKLLRIRNYIVYLLTVSGLRKRNN